MIKNIAQYIDSTNLNPGITRDEIKTIVDDAITYNFAGICITPGWTSFAKARLVNKGATNIKVVTVPNWKTGGGLDSCEGIWEDVCENCDEVDYIWNVVHFGDLKDWEKTKKELKTIREKTKGTLKIIIEAYYLRQMDEKIYKVGIKKVLKEACNLVNRSGADYIKCIDGMTSLFVKINNKLLYTNMKDLYDHHRNDVVYLPSVDCNGKFKWIKGLAIIKQNNKKEGLQLRLSNGLYINCTKEHKIPHFGRTINYNSKFKYKLKEAMNFKKGDYIGFLNNLNYEIEESEIYTSDLGFFVGMFLAEGTYTTHDRIRFHLGPRDKGKTLDKLKNIVSKFGYNYKIIKEKNSKGFTFFVNSPILRTILKEIIIGKLSKTKHLSNKLYNLPYNFRKGVMDGYLEGDGTTKNNEIYYIGMTNNGNLLADMVALCKTINYGISIGQKDYYLVKYKNKEYKTLNFQVYKRKRRDIGLRKIVDIKTISKRTVYDIETEDNHIFFTGYGLLIHNSDSGLFKRPDFDSLIEDCKIIKKYSKLTIKAAGGIRARYHVDELLKIGVKRIGTSKAVEIAASDVNI